ncbi:hypothetical protein [Helicobacter vulpis]|uniref:hypothetical protein n=1 Tax=Helicobacter vulpis TaxID=2316076 RepID=UPI0013CE32AE|nr:hypothetical protein [Helicobacter vulpis]
MVVFTPLLRAWTLLRYSVPGNIGALLGHRGVSWRDPDRGIGSLHQQGKRIKF